MARYIHPTGDVTYLGGLFNSDSIRVSFGCMTYFTISGSNAQPSQSLQSMMKE